MNFIKRISISLIILIGVFFNSCNSEYKSRFATNEENEIKIKIENILNEFGYVNFKIYTHFHKNMDQRVVSKASSSNRAIGDGILPLIEQYTGQHGYSISVSNEFEGYFENRAVTINYSDRNARNEIVYDYLSVIIIFEEITTERKNELLKLLNIYISNVNRGDIIYITSRNDIKK
jgi:hypothetical protein